MVLDRERARQRYGRLFDQVAEILFRHGPIGIAFEYNTDEYEPEASTILPRLENASSQHEALDAIHEEFVEWFFAGNAGLKTEYEELAAEVWSAWQQYKYTLPLAGG